MNRIKAYLLICCVFLAFSLAAQQRSASPVSFPDSVRTALENTRKADAGLVASAFAEAWASLRVDQQVVIQKQVWMMRKKKFPVRPHLVHYFGALSNAVNVEKADGSKISEFIRVAGAVIESEPSSAALNFFKVSNTFFEHRALHYAVLARDPEMVRLLMKHGADPSRLLTSGELPHDMTLMTFDDGNSEEQA